MPKKKLRQKPISEINVVPYIDVMLVLLVIFMITAPMLTQGISVELPKASSEKVDSGDMEPIIVSVNALGEYFLNIDNNPSAPISPQALLTRVAAEIKLAIDAHTKVNVLVKGDTNVAYGKVVAAMGLLKQSGAEQVGLITDNEEQTV